MFPFWKIAAPRVSVLLIAPSKYDDQGFVHRYWKGVISTSGLSTIAYLTRKALQNIVPSNAKIQIKTYEDSVFSHAVASGWFGLIWRIRSLLYRCLGIEHKLIVGLVSVQSHQFPRATDLIHRWQKRGATCVIGGSHVTASITAMLEGLGNRGEGPIPCLHIMPPEIKALQQQHVVIFHGEAEPHLDGTNAWQTALSKMISGQQPQALYRGGKPDISNTRLPELTETTAKQFSGRYVPVNTARGCPFKCKFCSVVTMQGRNMRCRLPSIVLEYFDDLCKKYGLARVFMIDDNFVRNRHRYEILNGLAQLREQGHKVSFMIQADVDACLKDEKLIPALAAAGCSMIFFGIESLKPGNLVAAGKQHNLGRDLPLLWRLCHKHNIIVHAAYMIGFQFDTPESVAAEVSQLHDFGADHASFYIRVPIPGCEDWARLVASGVPVYKDLNFVDSHHCTTDHGLQMSKEECEAAYHDAWRRFYTISNMIEARKRFSDCAARRRLLLVHLWYWWAIRVEHAHPMQVGGYRFRPYWDRRPSTPPLSVGKYACQEVWRHLRYVGYLFAIFFLFQQIEYETEFGLKAKRAAITGRLRGVKDWARRTFGQITHRGWLNEFWVRYAHNRWKLANPFSRWHFSMLPYAATEIVYTLRFACRFRRIVRSVRT